MAQTYTYTTRLENYQKLFNTTDNRIIESLVNQLCAQTGQSNTRAASVGRVDLSIVGSYEFCCTMRKLVENVEYETYCIDKLMSLELIRWLKDNAPSFETISCFLSDISLRFSDPSHEVVFKMRYADDMLGELQKG